MHACWRSYIETYHRHSLCLILCREVLLQNIKLIRCGILFNQSCIKQHLITLRTLISPELQHIGFPTFRLCSDLTCSFYQDYHQVSGDWFQIAGHTIWNIQQFTFRYILIIHLSQRKRINRLQFNINAVLGDDQVSERVTLTITFIKQMTGKTKSARFNPL